MSMCFEWLVEFIQWLLTGIWSDSRVGVFSLLEPEWRIAVPAIGGLVAGFILLFVKRRMPGQAMEYMEALAIGNGLIKVRASSLKVLSAAWSIASGAAIGKEGPIIQSSALIASAVGQKLHVSIPRLRLLVGCGAAAGFTTAFHAPFSGCLFVSEIIIGTVSMDILAPLLIASCTGFLMLHLLGDPSPLYSSPFESFTMFSQSLWCVALGVLAAVAAKGWVALLDVSNKYLNGRQSLLPVRLMAAGMLVGVIAIFYPEIVGNGKNIITALIHYEFDTTKAAILLALKICTVAIVFGVGTVGGALTPSLTIGSVFGFLFSAALTQMGVPGEHAIAYSLVGMAAFFTTAANAPITSLVLVVEFTMAGQMMFPLIIGVLVSYGTARLTKAQSMYHDSLAFGPRSTFDKPLAQVQLQDVARKDPPVVHPLDKFGTIASMLIKNPAQPIFVTSPAGKYLGSVEAEDVAAFARNKELAQAVLAMDVLRNDMPTLPADMHLPEALGIFSRPHCGESLALVNPDNDHLLGVVNKTDLYLVLSEIMRREKLQ